MSIQEIDQLQMLLSTWLLLSSVINHQAINHLLNLYYICNILNLLMRNSRKLGATGSLWWESVVALNLRFVLNTKLTSFCSTSATNDHALTVKYGLNTPSTITIMSFLTNSSNHRYLTSYSFFPALLLSLYYSIHNNCYIIHSVFCIWNQ